MSDVATPLGAPVLVKFGGKDVLLDGLKIGSVGIIQQHLRQEKKRQLREAIAELNELSASGLPAPIADSLNAEIIAGYRNAQNVTVAEALAWASGAEGLPFALWAVLSRRYGEQCTLDSVRQTVADMTPDEYAGLVENFLLATNGPPRPEAEKNSPPATA